MSQQIFSFMLRTFSIFISKRDLGKFDNSSSHEAFNDVADDRKPPKVAKTVKKFKQNANESLFSRSFL